MTAQSTPYASIVIGALAAATALSAAFASNRALSPVLLQSPNPVNEWASSMAVVAYAMIAASQWRSSTRRAGMIAAIGFATLTLVLLSINGLSSLLFAQFLHNPESARLLVFLGFSAMLLTSAVVGFLVSDAPKNSRATGIGWLLSVTWLVAFAVLWRT